MSETNEPFNIPDYSHDPNDTLAIVPNGDADDYSRLLSDLQRERMLRVGAQTERDAYKAVLSQYADKDNWLNERIANNPNAYDVYSDGNFNGCDAAQRVLATFATTAPEG